jgi:hypothetical protein
MDIIIYTSPEKLLHKQDKLENDPDKSTTGEYFWTLSRMPKECNESDKVYFATKGFIRGYFLIDSIDTEYTNCDINFSSDTWRDINPISCKHFQGFKYANKVKELTRKEVQLWKTNQSKLMALKR